MPAAIPPEYRAIIIDQQRQLARLVNSAGVGPVRNLYEDMLEQVTRRLGEVDQGTFGHTQLRGMLAQIKLGLARVQRAIGDTVERGATEVGIHAARSILQDTARLEKHFTGAVVSMPLLEAARLRGLVADQVPSLMRVHDTSMARFGTQLVRRFETELASAVGLGDSHARAIDRIAEIGGLEWHRAERIVRTEMAFAAGRSARAAADEQAEELEGDMWTRWTEHVTDDGTPLDDRVGVDSEAMHGQVAPPGGMFTQPPAAPDGEDVGDSLVGRQWASPPNRPNDRAVLVPWRAHWGVPGWRWEGRRVPVTEEYAQRQNARWMARSGSGAPEIGGRASASSVPAEPAIASDLHDEIVRVKDLGGGVNVSKIVRFSNGGSAVWKPAVGESDFDRPSGIEPNTMHVREAAAYDLSKMLELDVVPPTTVREHDGQEGSVQAFVKARPAWSAKKTDRESAEQMRLLDFITGNRDRHAGNFLLRKGGAVVAIDNGQAFPSERSGIIQPLATSKPFVGQGLLPSTRSRIAAIDLDDLAALMRRRGLSEGAVRHALYRATLLKEDPDVLAVPADLVIGGRPYRFDRVTTEHQERFLVEPSLTAGDRISAGGRQAADIIAARTQ